MCVLHHNSKYRVSYSYIETRIEISTSSEAQKKGWTNRQNYKANFQMSKNIQKEENHETLCINIFIVISHMALQTDGQTDVRINKEN